MLCFPNAKINIGLNVTEKRQDGFHNLETIFYPISLSDVLEFVEIKDQKPSFPIDLKITGRLIDADPKENICTKAYFLLRKNFFWELPELSVHLHKVVPIGAGLGGGSSNAAFFLKYLNDTFQLKLKNNELRKIAEELGSDCPFFINNQTSFAKGKGEILEPISLNLKGYHLYLITPNIHINTNEAYRNIKPKRPQIALKYLIQQAIEEWKNLIFNDFEKIIFPKYPQIKEIKSKLYDLGAIYASMSGSGSSVYGIFDKKVNVHQYFKKMFIWHEILKH